MKWEITWFCGVTCDIRLHSVSDFYALFQYTGFTCVIMLSGGDENFPEYKVICNDFETITASDTAESSSNLALSEQLFASHFFSKVANFRIC